ncbi:MAG: hypothetical protein F2795_07525 [Actinobacteria bacterium]|uniref:Unannotated protein n=1 Tax=freshwater metagenome TaxID=449393 RepID=A0A6J6RGN9_9ZZZZ|nr:hypothetical protein [Actinomycetota bacterium]
MRSSFKLFTWRGIAIGIHWSLFVIAALISWRSAGPAVDQARHVLAGVRIASVMTPNPVTVAPDITLGLLVSNVLPHLRSGGRRRSAASPPRPRWYLLPVPARNCSSCSTAWAATPARSW